MTAISGSAGGGRIVVSDRYMVVCNFTASTKTATEGTKAYAVRTTGGEPHRLTLRYRSRGGRWITKWENVRDLGNFRAQTIPEEHPMYRNALVLGRSEAETQASWWQARASASRPEEAQ